MRTSPAFIQWWKEIRAVLPVWALVMAAMWLPQLLRARSIRVFWSDWEMLAFLIGSALLAAVVWCREFQDRTMIWQLMQPVNRMSVFRRKFMVLLPALAILALSFLHLMAAEQVRMNGAGMFASFVVLLAMASVGFWSVLLRNVMSATALAIIVPALLLILCQPILTWLSDTLIARADYAAQFDVARWVESGWGFLALYAAVTGSGFLLLWQRLELRDGAIQVSAIDIRHTLGMAGDRAFKPRPWWLALLRKELGIVRFVFWIAALFGLAGLVYLVAHQTLEPMAAAALAGLQERGEAAGLSGPTRWLSILHLSAGIGFGFYLALVPALCGALAFAEETYFGSRPWQLCQPAGMNLQWLFKLGTALVTSLLLGLILPLALLSLAKLSGAYGGLLLEMDDKVTAHALTNHVLLFGLAAWSASRSRTTLSAILKTIAFVIGLMILNESTSHSISTHDVAFGWPLLVWPVAVTALLFTLLNFKQLEGSRGSRILQCGLLVALATVVAVGYHTID